MMQERKLEAGKEYWTLWYAKTKAMADRGGWYVAIYDEVSIKEELNRGNQMWVELVCEEMGVKKQDIEKSNDFARLFALYRQKEADARGMVTKVQVMLGSDFSNVPVRVSRGGISLCIFNQGRLEDAGKYLDRSELL